MSTPPPIGATVRIIAEGVVTAYDPGSDAVQLDHEECWWPYSHAGTSIRYEVVEATAERYQAGDIDPECARLNPELAEWHGNCCRFPKSCSPRMNQARADALNSRVEES